MVARIVRDDEVAGSNPVTPTSGKPLWLGVSLRIRAAFVVLHPPRILSTANSCGLLLTLSRRHVRPEGRT